MCFWDLQKKKKSRLKNDTKNANANNRKKELKLLLVNQVKKERENKQTTISLIIYNRKSARNSKMWRWFKYVFTVIDMSCFKWILYFDIFTSKSMTTSKLSIHYKYFLFGEAEKMVEWENWTCLVPQITHIRLSSSEDNSNTDRKISTTKDREETT